MFRNRSRDLAVLASPESDDDCGSRLQPAAADDADQSEDDGDDEQDVQCAAEGVLGDDAEQPEYDENGDDDEHGGLRADHMRERLQRHHLWSHELMSSG